MEPPGGGCRAARSPAIVITLLEIGLPTFQAAIAPQAGYFDGRQVALRLCERRMEELMRLVRQDVEGGVCGVSICAKAGGREN